MLPHLSMLAKHHALITFFVLAYGIAWSLMPFGGPFLPIGPLLAALVVIAVTEGRAGLRVWGGRLIQWHVGWRWYAAALGLPLAAAIVATALSVALGASWSLDQLPAWSSLIGVFALRLINPLDGALGEEPGWRGYALPGLQVGRSPLVATLILGLLVAGWHLPLVWRGQLPAIGLLGTIAVTFLYTWLFNQTGGSAFLTLVMHAAEGTFFRFTSAGLPGTDAARGIILYCVVLSIVAIALLMFDRSAWRSAAPSLPSVPSAQPATGG